MKLPLKWGLLVLAALAVLHSALEAPNARTVVLVVAMGVALWTAFSLNIPPRREPEPEPLLEPPEDGEPPEDEGASEGETGNGGGESRKSPPCP